MADQSSYTRVPNTIFDALAELTEVRLKLVLTVVRKTIGWQKECDAISLSQFEQSTGLSRPAIVEALKSLVAEGWLAIVGTGKRGTPCWSCGARLVNSVNQSTELTSELSLPDLVNSVNRSSPGLVNSVNTQKKDLKERIKKGGERAKRATPPPKQASMSGYSEPVQIYKELTGQKSLAPVIADKLAETIIDCQHWRTTLAAWLGAGYSAKNTDGMIDWYLHPDKATRKNGNGGSNGRNLQPHSRQPLERAQWRAYPTDDEAV